MVLEMRVLNILLVVLCAPSVRCYLKEKLDFITTCYKADPNFNNCLSSSMQRIIWNLRNGFPQFGVPSLDPLYIPELKLMQEGSGPVSFDIYLQDVVQRGLSRCEVSVNRVNVMAHDITLQFRIPRTNTTAIFVGRGRFLMVPVQTRGDVWQESEDVSLLITLSLSVSEREALKFYNVRKLQVKFDVRNFSVRTRNLFNGATDLEESTNRALNDNWRHLLDYLRPVLSKMWSEMLTPVVNSFLNLIPANYLVGDI